MEHCTKKCNILLRIIKLYNRCHYFIIKIGNKSQLVANIDEEDKFYEEKKRAVSVAGSIHGIGQ